MKNRWLYRAHYTRTAWNLGLILVAYGISLGLVALSHLWEAPGMVSSWPGSITRIVNPPLEAISPLERLIEVNPEQADITLKKSSPEIASVVNQLSSINDPSKPSVHRAIALRYPQTVARSNHFRFI